MDNLVIVRGGGDIATGTICKLYNCGFKVLVLEIRNPSAIRRHVAFSEAVYEGKQTIENITCYLAENITEAEVMLEQGKLTMLVDEDGQAVSTLNPLAVVDGILAKKNLGTTRDMGEITIGLGPGFVAGQDVDAVIETMRGHNLGRVIYEGAAEANTGIPGEISGYGRERVVRCPGEGILRNINKIGDTVSQNDVIAVVESPEGNIPVHATIDGLLRGMIRDGYPVTKGFKIADIDPRLEEYQNCFTVSDKARCIAGGVLEAIMYLRGRKHD